MNSWKRHCARYVEEKTDKIKENKLDDLFGLIVSSIPQKVLGPKFDF